MADKRNIINLATEQPSTYSHIEHMTVAEITYFMNREDKRVPDAIEAALPQINLLVECTVEVIKNGGRLFYIGAGTSGRLGIVDASECPPTFGTDPEMVVGIIAGGHGAMFQAVEGAEDNPMQGSIDLEAHGVSPLDFVVGISASGQAPYVVNALAWCRENSIATGCICSNRDSQMARNSDFPIEVTLGPEFISGSSRLKSGTAQKLILNMISTTTFAKNGGVVDNVMANMKATNYKLVERGINNLMQRKGVGYDEAKKMIEQNGGSTKGLLT